MQAMPRGWSKSARSRSKMVPGRPAEVADATDVVDKPDVADDQGTPSSIQAPAREVGSWREALVAGLLGTVASLLFRGFEGGRWSDIPIFKSFVDPRLYLNDPFVQALHEGTPAAYTYRLIAAVIGALPWLPLDGALFILFVPASVASLALAYRLARQLVGDRVSAILFL